MFKVCVSVSAARCKHVRAPRNRVEQGQSDSAVTYATTFSGPMRRIRTAALSAVTAWRLPSLLWPPAVAGIHPVVDVYNHR